MIQRHYEITRSSQEIDSLRDLWQSTLYESRIGVFKGPDVQFLAESETVEDGYQIVKGTIFIPRGYIIRTLPAYMGGLGDLDYEEKFLACLFDSDRDNLDRRNANNISVKSGIEQSTGVTVSFEGPLYYTMNIPGSNKSGLAISTILEFHNPIEINVPKGTCFNLGRIFDTNWLSVIDDTRLESLAAEGKLFEEADFDPVTHDPSKISYVYQFFTSEGGIYVEEAKRDYLDSREKIYQLAFPNFAGVKDRRYYANEPVRYPIGVAVPYHKRFIMTADHIDLPYISSLTRVQRPLLDQHLGLVEVPLMDEAAINGRYSLVQTKSFAIPDGYNAIVNQITDDYRVGNMSVSDHTNGHPSFHLPSVVIDSGWKGPIRGEVINAGKFKYGYYMFLTYYKDNSYRFG